MQNIIHQYVTLDKIEFNQFNKNINFPNNENVPDTNKIEDKSLQKAVEDFEKDLIKKLLEKNQWHRGQVSKILNINYRTLLRKIKRYGLK